MAGCCRASLLTSFGVEAWARLEKFDNPGGSEAVVGVGWFSDPVNQCFTPGWHGPRAPRTREQESLLRRWPSLYGAQPCPVQSHSTRHWCEIGSPKVDAGCRRRGAAFSRWIAFEAKTAWVSSCSHALPLSFETLPDINVRSSFLPTHVAWEVCVANRTSIRHNF